MIMKHPVCMLIDMLYFDPHNCMSRLTPMLYVNRHVSRYLMLISYCAHLMKCWKCRPISSSGQYMLYIIWSIILTVLCVTGIVMLKSQLKAKIHLNWSNIS